MESLKWEGAGLPGEGGATLETNSGLQAPVWRRGQGLTRVLLKGQRVFLASRAPQSLSQLLILLFRDKRTQMSTNECDYVAIKVDLRACHEILHFFGVFQLFRKCSYSRGYGNGQQADLPTLLRSPG